MRRASAAMRIADAAQHVAQLDRHGKLEWLQRRKELGNAYFSRRRFREAADMYVEALLGLDLGGRAEDRQRVVQERQVPVTLNLAACFVELRQWDKVLPLCKEVRPLGGHRRRLPRLSPTAPRRCSLSTPPTPRRTIGVVSRSCTSAAATSSGAAAASVVATRGHAWHTGRAAAAAGKLWSS